MALRRRHHYLICGITLLLTAVCAFLAPRVKVNSDMTKYLPDSSQMKEGLGIVEEEFGGTQTAIADVQVMYKGLDEEERRAIEEGLAGLPEVDGLNVLVDGSGEYTLYELSVSKSIDQKAFGREISDMFGKEAVVETSQDGATPPLSVIIIAAVLVVLVIVLMAQSWLEPLVFLLTTGVAILLNLGTNALLPSVSITTNYIGAILQMVLSLDYSIVLINRYRQEQRVDKSSAQAVNSAIKKAFSSIVSSGLTTIVGLVMLCFMRLKIGMDMGIVLAKGVFLSLICTFTVLPSLLLLFDKGIRNTSKRTFVLPTNGLSRFVTSHKIALSLLAIALFVGSYFFSRKTEISFSTANESEISKVFPNMSPVVLLYETQDEMSTIALADSLRSLDGVEGVLSYASLLKSEYAADEMVSRLGTMYAQFEDLYEDIPQEVNFDGLTPELMRLVYYLKYQDDPQMRVAFPEMAEFITEYCVDNPLFSGFMDEEMKENLELMKAMTAVDFSEVAAEQVQETEPQDIKEETVPVVEEAEPEVPKLPVVVKPVEVKPVTAAPAQNTGSISVRAFMPKLEAAYPSFESTVLRTIVDVEKINQPMTASEMSQFIGSTAFQTKMVYSFSKGDTMTPLQYVHFLADDLFKRKALSRFVNEEQKHGLVMRMKVMDYANSDSSLSAAEMAALLEDFGVSGITEQTVTELMYPKEESATTTYLAKETETSAAPTTYPETKDTTALAAATPDSSAVQEPKPAPVKPKKTQEEYRAELFAKMMSGEKAYTSAELAKNFKRLGQNIDAETVSLLYTYYGSVKKYDENNKMSIEDLIDFATGGLLEDERFAAFIGDDMREQIFSTKEALAEGVGMLRNDKHSLMLVITGLPDESPETYAFVDKLTGLSDEALSGPHYFIGESVMYSEMKASFNDEVKLVTWLTVAAIFLIIALVFHSLVVPLILVATVMTAVFVNVAFSGLISGHMLYLAYLIVQSILMGATIDYGILFTNYYKEKRNTLPVNQAVSEAYKGSIRTIMTSGLVMVAAPGVMALLVDDVTISAIVGSLSIGALVSILLILTVLPAILAAFDKFVVWKKKDKKQ